jgi:hypothetical protein
MKASYHVAYYWKDNNDQGYGDMTFDADRKIQNRTHLLAVRAKIKEEGRMSQDALVVILNIIRL